QHSTDYDEEEEDRAKLHLDAR
nr:RecName: Full=Fibrinogen beta chain; Contains: RecName: Full=Fibrinopeptide B [Cervus elaphus]P68119.1 RecName: Full=Fibrinogen beta chain; Contains: RecName: Full=Fibrinopeptide B [Cervus canadensis nelsoni]